MEIIEVIKLSEPVPVNCDICGNLNSTYYTQIKLNEFYVCSNCVAHVQQVIIDYNRRIRDAKEKEEKEEGS